MWGFWILKSGLERNPSFCNQFRLTANTLQSLVIGNCLDICLEYRQQKTVCFAFSSAAVSTETEDSKLHRCMHCSFKSKTFSNLKRHLTSHTDERAFACTMCNLRFKQKIHLQKHINYIHLVSVTIVLKILRTGKFIIKCKSTVENHPGEKIVNPKHFQVIFPLSRERQLQLS